MIPYLEVGSFDVFGLELRPFFLLVVSGVILGVVCYDRICKRGGLIDRRIALHLPEICVLGGFIGAHLVHVVFYDPEEMSRDAWVLFKIWGGYSSIGGFLGGMLAGIAYIKWKKQDILPYGDRLLFGLSTGWILGRTGCAVTHDHPGALTDFPLAVMFPDGPRHDMGLYELWLTIVIVIVLFLISRKPRRSSAHMVVILLMYSTARFFLDFLRATDTKFVDERYLGLTPAQYGTIALFAAGVYLALTLRKRPMDAALFGPLKPPGRTSPQAPP